MPDISESTIKETANQVNGVTKNPDSSNASESSANGVRTAENIAPNAPRKKKLVRKQKGPNPIKYKLWLAGHLSCIVFGCITFVFQIFWLPNKFYINSIAYRLSLLGSIVALLATVSHKYGLRYLPPSSTLIAQQNFQFVVLGAVWLFTFKSVFKIIPFFLTAVLQIANHKNISAVVKQADFLASFIAYDELVLIVYLLLRTLCFRGTSGFQLVLFLLFYWLRILYNPETTNLFKTIINRLDGKVQNVKNEKVVHYWDKIKMTIEQKSEE